MIRKIRRRIKDKKWLDRKLNSLMNEMSEWNTFYQFECSSFFRGRVVADYNIKKWEKGAAKTERQILFVTKLLTNKP